MKVCQKDDMLTFKDEPETSSQAPKDRLPPWNVLVVDDEPDVHSVTKLALDSWTYGGRPLKLTHASSGREAIDMLRDRGDYAVILLDVVMESELAGLDVAEYLRKRLNNNRTQIILRTGHPGTLTDNEAAAVHGCNFYEPKSYITSERLKSTLAVALKDYSSPPHPSMECGR